MSLVAEGPGPNGDGRLDGGQACADGGAVQGQGRANIALLLCAEAWREHESLGEVGQGHAWAIAAVQGEQVRQVWEVNRFGEAATLRPQLFTRPR